MLASKQWRIGSLEVCKYVHTFNPRFLIQTRTVAPSPPIWRPEGKVEKQGGVGIGSDEKGASGVEQKSGLDYSRVLFCVQPRTKERRKTEKRLDVDAWVELSRRPTPALCCSDSAAECDWVKQCLHASGNAAHRQSSHGAGRTRASWMLSAELRLVVLSVAHHSWCQTLLLLNCFLNTKQNNKKNININFSDIWRLWPIKY